jgi:3-oxoacyl-[acyl-carrier protein] reductase
MTGQTNKKLKALVTGASRGIGAAIVIELEAQGIEVITPSRNILDLGDLISVENYITKEKSLGIDILVNNAGVNFLNDITDMDDRDWQSMIQINLTAVMQLVRGFSPHMKQQNWGRIINISSIFSMVTKESRGAYSATKAGLNGLTRTAAVELAPYGILVNSVCPGYVQTDLTVANNSPEQILQISSNIPIKRLAQPAEIAKLVSFLSSKENSYMTGQSLLIDGGFTCR